MNKIVVTKFGGPEVLVLKEDVAPILGAGQIRIAVKAAGVNFADVMMRMGLYPEAPSPPFTPGYEIAGEVTEVGTSTKGYVCGDRVVAAVKFHGYVSEACVEPDVARKIPESVTYEEAASIPVNWLTAWVALEDMARVREGDRVLIHSAAGGVGVAAVQIAKARGATVIGLTSSPSKKSTIMDLGADDVWTNDEWTSKNSERFDIIIEALGAKEHKRCFSRLARTGRIVTLGISSMIRGQRRSIVKVVSTMISTPIYSTIGLMMQNKGVFGLNMLKLLDPQEIPKVAHALDLIIERFAAKRFRAVVGSTFPLVEAGMAHEHLLSKRNIGKVILTL